VNRVVLRPFEESDFPLILKSISSSDDLLQWAGPDLSWPLDEAQLREYRAHAASNPETSRPLSAAVEDSVVGHVHLVLDPRHDVGYVGRVLVSPTDRGRGVGKALMREVVRLAFDDLRLHRLSLNVFDFNIPAIRCYEHAGFIKEGHLRDTRLANDGYWSMFIMGMLETDPRTSTAG
jgi:RimJ/RimL family protein N-acetyltransferase